jgi:hypothetical protein
VLLEPPAKAAADVFLRLEQPLPGGDRVLEVAVAGFIGRGALGANLGGELLEIDIRRGWII